MLYARNQLEGTLIYFLLNSVTYIINNILLFYFSMYSYIFMIYFMIHFHSVCYYSSAEAVNRIYDIKGRKYTNPLAICVGDVQDIQKYAITDHLPHGLLDCLLPGPVTVVLMRGLKLVMLFSLVILAEGTCTQNVTFSIFCR